MSYDRRIYHQAGSGANHLRWLMYLDKEFPNLNSMDKLEFINVHIYNKRRTWNNWLETEWSYRAKLDSVVSINHDANTEVSNTLTLYMIFQNQQLPFEHYFHINLGLNNSTPDKFIDDTRMFHGQSKFKSRLPNVKVLTCDVMFERKLNQDFYLEVCEFFQFDNHFNTAQEIHELWYLAREKSAEDFCKYFLGDEFQNYVYHIKEKYNL